MSLQLTNKDVLYLNEAEPGLLLTQSYVGAFEAVFTLKVGTNNNI